MLENHRVSTSKDCTTSCFGITNGITTHTAEGLPLRHGANSTLFNTISEDSIYYCPIL